MFSPNTQQSILISNLPRILEKKKRMLEYDELNDGWSLKNLGFCFHHYFFFSFLKKNSVGIFMLWLGVFVDTLYDTHASKQVLFRGGGASGRCWVLYFKYYVINSILDFFEDMLVVYTMWWTGYQTNKLIWAFIFLSCAMEVFSTHKT